MPNCEDLAVRCCRGEPFEAERKEETRSPTWTVQMQRMVHFWLRTKHRCYRMNLVVEHPIPRGPSVGVMLPVGRSEEMISTSAMRMCKSCRLSARRSRFVMRIDNARNLAAAVRRLVWIQDPGPAWRAVLAVLGQMLRDVVVGNIEWEELRAFGSRLCRLV